MYLRHLLTRKSLSIGLVILFFPGIVVAIPPLSGLGDLLYWFSADTNVWSDSNATTIATDETVVLGWTDQVAGLHIMSPTASSARSPSYVSNGINNLPALDFRVDDGGVDVMQTKDISPAVIANTIFFVFQPRNEITPKSSTQILLHTSTGAGESVGLGKFHNNSLPGAIIGTVSRSSTGKSPTYYSGYGPAKLSTGQPYVFTAVHNAKKQRFDLYLDGINIGNLNRSSDNTGLFINQLVVGANIFTNALGFEGLISEVILYKTSLSDTNRVVVEDYLANKYLIPSTNLAFRFSADAEVWANREGTLPVSDGINVHLWKDQSGNHYDLSSVGKGSDHAPTLIRNGIGGRPSLQFNSALHTHESSSDKMQHTAFSGTLKTLFYVFQPDQALGNSTDSALAQTLLSGISEITTVKIHNSISKAHIGLTSSDGAVPQSWGYDPEDKLDIPAYPTVLSIRWSSSTNQYDIRINGASVGNLTSGTDPDAFGLNGLHLGSRADGAAGFQGKISEIIAYTSELSSSQNYSVERYLKGKYAAPNTYYVDNTKGLDDNDGLSPISAWKSFQPINNRLLIPGDTILLKRGEIWRDAIVVPNSGTPGLPITFRAYGTGNKPLLHGGRSGTGIWTDKKLDGVYTMTGLANVSFVAENNELIPWASDSACLNGNWYWDKATKTIYYRPTSGVFEESIIDLITTYTTMRLVGRSHIEIYDLAFTLVDRGIYANGTATSPNHDITISNSDFSKMAHGIIILANNNHENSDSIISNNYFTNIRHSIAVYAQGNGVGTNRNFLITNNTILNAGVAAAPQIWTDFLPADDDGIGLQNMNDSIISHNKIVNGLGIRSGIGMWVNKKSVARGNQFTYNYLENILGSGITPGGQGSNSGGHTVAYNIIVNSGFKPDLPYGYGWGALRLNNPQNPPTKVYNNLLVGNDINIHLNGGPDNYQISNNISYQPSGYHAFLNGRMKNNLMGNNLYFPDAPNIFSHSGYGPMNFQDWISLTFQDSPNSTVADPNFISPESPADYHLRSNSPAINPNIDVREIFKLEDNYLDYDDQPLVSTPDLGPYEFQGSVRQDDN